MNVYIVLIIINNNHSLFSQQCLLNFNFQLYLFSVCLKCGFINGYDLLYFM